MIYAIIISFTEAFQYFIWLSETLLFNEAKRPYVVEMADSKVTTTQLINGFQSRDWLIPSHEFQRFIWMIDVLL